jgi:transmembrane sensor
LDRSVSVLGRRENEIEAEAAEWVIRLGGGPLRDEERRTLDRWLAESPSHALAFDHARSTWADLGGLRALRGALGDDVVAPRRRSSVRSPDRHRPVGVSMLRAAAIVVVAVVGTGFAAFWLGDPVLMLEADYRTAPGETRSVTLADGTTVQLDTASALAVRFDGRERRVALLSGEAYFTVAPSRPPTGQPKRSARSSWWIWQPMERRSQLPSTGSRSRRRRRATTTGSPWCSRPASRSITTVPPEWEQSCRPISTRQRPGAAAG